MYYVDKNKQLYFHFRHCFIIILFQKQAMI